jgi:hypothetical protein
MVYLKRRQQPKPIRFSLKQFFVSLTLIGIGTGIQVWTNRFPFQDGWQVWCMFLLLSISGGSIGAGIAIPFRLPWLTYWVVVMGLFLGLFIPMMIHMRGAVPDW